MYNPLRNLLIISLFSLSMIHCTSDTLNQTPTTRYFVTTLGKDTLALEKYTQNDSGVYAEVILRSPKTTLLIQQFNTDKSGNFLSYSSNSYIIKETVKKQNSSESVKVLNDSIQWKSTTDETERSGIFLYDSLILPFIDMVHWPFDIMTQRQNSDSSSVPVFSGARVFSYIVQKMGDDSLTLKHPTRGTMGVTINEDKSIRVIDASLTTRKLLVTSVEPIDMDLYFIKYSDLDMKNKSFGSLSGRAEETFSVVGTTLSFDYGTPAQRGREIWGKLVPYNKLWRTGANKATHVTFSDNIQMDTLTIPAGQYTLFTIPSESGGILIINKQTGQNGQQYNESLNLGTVQMMTRNLDHSVELFTIRADEENGGGVIRLQWGDREMVIPFKLIK